MVYLKVSHDRELGKKAPDFILQVHDLLKVLSAPSLAQLDFLAGLATLKAHLPNGQMSRQVIL